ncbi:hypothetical protein [Flagellimonas sp. MMG031]|uniref:Uncharacterized protein n=1 Tax=Flagellimonas sp. MMG031 TaxID=3158549 RepID=A0AAU7MWH1_9FLAO
MYKHVGALLAKAYFCCYVLRTSTLKEMYSNDPLNQIIALTYLSRENQVWSN